MLPSIEQRLAAEIAAKPAQIATAIALLDEGATVPFYLALSQRGDGWPGRYAAALAGRPAALWKSAARP
jgi:hypothetical protein